MNLEDFKSFCRVLIPSEVGSIPTHSRHPLPGRGRGRVFAPYGAMAAVLLLTIAAFAEEDAGGADTTPEEVVEAELSARMLAAESVRTGEGVPGAAAVPGPMERAFRSALFPAWGQLTNGKSKKAAVLFSVQTYIYTRVIVETRKAREAERRAERLEAATDPESVFLREAAETSAQEHFDRRRDLLFWALVGGFYGAMDAYIDAQLGEFEADLEKDRTLFGSVDPGRGELAVGMRF